MLGCAAAIAGGGTLVATRGPRGRAASAPTVGAAEGSAPSEPAGRGPDRPALAGQRPPTPATLDAAAAGVPAPPEVYLAPSNGYAPEPPPLPEDEPVVVEPGAKATDAEDAGPAFRDGSSEARLAAATARLADEARPPTEVARFDVTAVVADRTRMPGRGWPARDALSWSDATRALSRRLEQALLDAHLDRPARVAAVEPSGPRVAFDVDGGPDAIAAAARVLDAETTLGGPAFTVRVEVRPPASPRDRAPAAAATLVFDVPADGVVTAHAGPARVRWTDLDIQVGNFCDFAPIFGVEREGVFVRGHLDVADPAVPTVVLFLDDVATRLEPYTAEPVAGVDVWPSPAWIRSLGLLVPTTVSTVQTLLRVEAREGAAVEVPRPDGGSVRATVEAVVPVAPRVRRWRNVPRAAALEPSSTVLPDTERLEVTVEVAGLGEEAATETFAGSVDGDGPERAVVVASSVSAASIGVAEDDEPARTALSFAAPLSLWVGLGPAVPGDDGTAPRAFDVAWEAVGATSWADAVVPTRFPWGADPIPTATVRLPSAPATVVPWRLVLRPGEAVRRDLVLDVGDGPRTWRVSIRRLSP